MQAFFREFNYSYRCHSMEFIHRPELNSGGKIILPPSALNILARLNIEYPMLFELQNRVTGATTYGGVLEFVAEEGRCYLPYWMMNQIGIDENGIVSVRSAQLSAGTYVKLQPHSKTFLDISNPRAVLENALRSFSTLTTGDSIMIEYNNKQYYLDILETRPTHAISIVETDLNVEFAAPLDYVEPTPEPTPTTRSSSSSSVASSSRGVVFGASSGTASTSSSSLSAGTKSLSSTLLNSSPTASSLVTTDGAAAAAAGGASSDSKSYWDSLKTTGPRRLDGKPSRLVTPTPTSTSSSPSSSSSTALTTATSIPAPAPASSTASTSSSSLSSTSSTASSTPSSTAQPVKQRKKRKHPLAEQGSFQAFSGQSRSLRS